LIKRLTSKRSVWPGVVLGAVTLVVVLASGPRSVTAAARFAGCPSQVQHVIRSSRVGARVMLVPSEAQRVLLCRYDGPFGDSGCRSADRFRLIARRVIDDPRSVASLAGELNRLPTMSGAYAFPNDTGAAILALFGYDSGPDDPVKVDMAGCMEAANGYVVRTAGLNGATTLDELETLIHATRSRSSRHHGARDAIIDGYVRLCGGPAPGRCFIASIGECNQAEGCTRSDRVVAIDTAGEQVAQQQLPPAHAQFRLRVQAGNYAVELLADGKRVHDRLLQTHGATARAGHTTTVIFNFDVP
jgi:hypothetical protein